MRAKVRSQVGMLDSVYITDDDVDGYHLEFQNILAGDTEWNEMTGSFMTSGGVRYYDVPKDLITMRLVQFDVWVLPHRSLHDLIRDYPLALTSAYTSSRPWSYTLEANRLMLFPVPTAASGVMVIYSALPPQPVSDDSLFYWPSYFDTAALFYGAMRASMKDFSREGNRKVAVFTAAFDREYAKAIERLNSRGEEDIAVYGEGALGSSHGYSSFPRRVPFPPQ